MLFSPSSGFLASISLVLLLISPSAIADCTRSDLLAVADKFVTAISSGSIGSLPFAANFTYLENNKVATINRTAVFAQPLKIDLNRSTADTVACASYTLIISASGPKPYVLATQIRHPKGGDTSVIAKVDTIAATTGSLFFNATKTLGYIRKENWDEIPEAQRPSRDLLKKGTDCERVEGSEYTRPCGASLPHSKSQRNNGNRRYMIDEVVGSVDILCSFNALGSLPDSHEIRVEEGKVKYVHTVTV
ncbi:uncharacterized protein THITE_122346 [Thermothielavioides terrestris NRRL 8126]|uniref:DUF8021 domain-containing protein n=1 Tax=Thermothielavioides terrestris (strain ATCC 38088 / NRRL 8126) TaxID=578455 RepID=G2RAU8_THETT|nr:uncharacterized protein THITE_122346 [Thermothielavioides terrestris NRRL 8126]AEO69779.1 hypothetical protein THITE_122346 [Thermothielavioides terrestris NRRL 8126]